MDRNLDIYLSLYESEYVRYFTSNKEDNTKNKKESTKEDLNKCIYNKPVFID